MIFLGTAAAECYPNPFCTCPSCELARRSSDPKLRRRRSSMLFDETMMIDFNADAMAACGDYGVALDKLDHVLITHMHEDHFDYWNAAFPLMAVNPARTLTFYTSQEGYDGLMPILEAACRLPHPQLAQQMRDMMKISRFEVMPRFEPRPIGDKVVTALPARHDGFFTNEKGFSYLIEKDGKTTLYASDTGRFFPETMAYLSKVVLDTLVIEGTFGQKILSETAGHLDRESLCLMLDTMFEQGTLTKNSRIYVTHIGHKGVYTHYDYQAYLDERYHGQVVVAWDGLRI